MTNDLASILASLPSMEEQAAITAHNKPVLDAVALVYQAALRTYGSNDARTAHLADVYDDFHKLAADWQRIEKPYE